VIFTYLLVSQHFDVDVYGAKLKIQMQMLSSSPSIVDASIVNVEQVIGELLSLGDGMQIVTEVIKLIRLCLTIPVSSATAVRSFSTFEETENVHPFDNEGKPPNTPSLASCPLRSY